jgi:glyoxylase-like metal-dependent hydrolase (beta-lactamase superfamily II)
VTQPAEIAPGIWRWTGRHPQWHPGEFGAEVASFALEAGDDLLLIDPLLPEDKTPVLDLLDRLAQGRTTSSLVTIGYHVRSAEQLAERYGGRIHGPPTCAKRLRNAELLSEDPNGPAGTRAYAIGKPRRSERPIWIPSHKALAFGDALVANPDGDLRVWVQDPVDDKLRRFYRERFNPTLDPLLELPVEHVLVTHGDPVVGDGAAKLKEAVAAEPWYHHG